MKFRPLATFPTFHPQTYPQKMWIKNFYHCQGRCQAVRVRIKRAIQPERLGAVDIVHDGMTVAAGAAVPVCPWPGLATYRLMPARIGASGCHLQRDTGRSGLEGRRSTGGEGLHHEDIELPGVFLLVSIPGDRAFILQFAGAGPVDGGCSPGLQRLPAGRSACGCNERDSGDPL